MGRGACLTMVQRVGYSLPAFLVTPVIAIVSSCLEGYRQAHPDVNLLSFFSELLLS